MAEKLLRNARPPLAGDGLLQLLELLLHQMMDGLAGTLQRPLGGSATDQVDRVETALRRFALVGAQVVRQAHPARGLADVAEDPVLQFLRGVLRGAREDRA